MKKLFIIGMASILLLPSCLMGQEYKLLAKKKEIGILKVLSSSSGQKSEIKVTTKVQVNLLGQKTIDYELQNKYENDELVHSNVVTYVNSKLHSTSEVKQNADGYTIVKDGATSHWNHKEKYTGAMLYSVEPIGVDHVFSEIDGVIKKVRKVSAHTYEIIHPEKKKQTQEFTYEGGVLKKGTINHPLVTFYLVKI